MRDERTTPLRQRMIEDMDIRGLAEKTQKAHIRNVKLFAAFLGRSPDTATPDDLRAWQLHMVKAGVSASTFNVRIISLRFFFGVTCGREEMKRYMQFHRQPRKLPVVLSVEEVAKLLDSVPGPGLKYRAALGISYGAGLRVLGGVHPEGQGHRQPADADPCRAGQNSEALQDGPSALGIRYKADTPDLSFS